MAVTLRLARFGHKKRVHYRIVAAEKTKKRDGRFLEIVGTYNPRVNPPQVTLKEEKVKKWVNDGAQTSGVVHDLIRKRIPGLLEQREKHQLEKVQARRKARKQRLASRPGAAPKAKKASSGAKKSTPKKAK